MKIIEKLAKQRALKEPAFSFEFFPPKDEEGMERLFETVARLRPYEPAYVSVTWGAGGSTRRLTVELVRQIAQSGMDAMAHLTCVGASRGELMDILDQLSASGIENVLVLRGDPPKGEVAFCAPADGFGHASDLARYIRAERGDAFCLAGACYPEKHVDAANLESDLNHLKSKVDAGVDFLVTQLFFDNQAYFRFVEAARAAGIGVPIVAGIMPITNVSQIKRFTALCGATIPPELLGRLESVADDAERVVAAGVDFAVKQCRELLAHGVPGIHFYTLNRSPATVQILDALKAG